MTTAAKANSVASSKEASDFNLKCAMAKIMDKARSGFFSCNLLRRSYSDKTFEALKELGYKIDETNVNEKSSYNEVTVSWADMQISSPPSDELNKRIEELKNV